MCVRESERDRDEVKVCEGRREKERWKKKYNYQTLSLNETLMPVRLLWINE